MNTLTPAGHFDLDTPLIDLATKFGSSHWTIREAVEGIQIFGGIGSGKTSGSGRMIALKFLKNGFGGLVLTAKPDEKELWQEYCQLSGRSDDLVIIEPGGKHSFDFLDYEAKSAESGETFTDNIVQLLKTVINASEEKAKGKSDDPFWEKALDMLIFNVIDLCLLAYGTVSVKLMYDIVLTAPKKEESPAPEGQQRKAFTKAFETAVANVRKLIDAWEATLPPGQLQALYKSEDYEFQICEAIPQAATFKMVDQFFIENYRELSEKTRSIIEMSFSGFLFRLLKEPVYSLFCKNRTTVKPDDCLNGKIILLNIPVKKYHKVGRDCQIMFKYIWQRTMEKRDVKVNGRPVFLWADEAQNFLHEHDADYQATARSSRIATVYISQNLPNYHANMGGEKSDYRVKSFLGTLGTKIFHANADIETNRYASDLIGEAYEEDISESTTVAGKFSSSESKSYKLVKMVRPEAIMQLKNGSAENSFKVDGIVHRQARKFPSGFNHEVIRFNQQYKP